MRLVKRYVNRKLYDTTDRRYVTLLGLAAHVREGDDVKVQDHVTGQDLTAQTLAQIILCEEQQAPRVSVDVLVKLIREGVPEEKAA